MPEKKLPVALIGAFFVIGILLGLLYIQSDGYRALREGVRAYLGQPDNGPSRRDVATVATRPRQALPAVPPEVAEQEKGATTETFVCDTASALAIRNKARSIAEIAEKADGSLHVRMREQWTYYTPGIRRSFLQAFAESDTCLLGHSRIIHFYYQGQEFATSRPPAGLATGK